MEGMPPSRRNEGRKVGGGRGVLPAISDGFIDKSSVLNSCLHYPEFTPAKGIAILIPLENTPFSECRDCRAAASMLNKSQGR